MLRHLTDAVGEIDRSIAFIDWRYCVDALQETDTKNRKLNRARELFESLQKAQSELMDLLGVEEFRKNRGRHTGCA